MTAQAPRLARLTEAGEWLLRLNHEARTEGDVAEWLAWCDACPENLEAFELIQHDWHDLDLLKLQNSPSTETSFSARPYLSSVRWRWAAGIATLALTLAVAAYYWRNPASVQQVAAANSNKTATLPDGSSVVLSAQTQVEVDFTGAGRELSLSPGEAYFKVHRDKHRPFTVHAGEVSVTAIGTAFNVRRGRDRIVVTVEEGIVEISSATTPGVPDPTWRVEAGYQLTYSAALRTATLASVDPLITLKWREGELAYVWETLGNVVADVNRYSHHRIVLEDRALADLRFTGTVFTSAVEDWLKAIQDAYPVQARVLPNGDFALSSLPPDETRFSQFKNSSTTR